MTLIDKAEALAAIEDLFITADNDREEGYDEGVAACLEAIVALPPRRVEVKPCGGCGNDDPLKRCIGCFHDFGTPDSACVHRYAPLVPTDAAQVREAALMEAVNVCKVFQANARTNDAWLHACEIEEAILALIGDNNNDK